MKLPHAFLVFFLVLLASLNAAAHKSNIGLLQVTQLDGTKGQTHQSLYNYAINWSFTGVKMQEFPTPVMPGFCEQSSVNRTSQKDSGISELYNIQCSQSLLGTVFTFAGESDQLRQLILSWDNGDTTVEKFFTSEAMHPVITVKDFSNPAASQNTSNNFFVVGIEHMIFGWDHVLFVISLLLLTGITRKIFLTVTGFTIGHSLTLFLATSGALALPSAPVEALIALSIVYMASEALRTRRGETSLFRKYPLAISSGFGLLHGLGFAGALKELAVSEELGFEALLLFNLGIEAAQLLVVACVAVAILIFLQLKNRFGGASFRLYGLKQPEVIFSYFIGTTAAYWFVERTINMV